MNNNTFGDYFSKNDGYKSDKNNNKYQSDRNDKKSYNNNNRANYSSDRGSSKFPKTQEVIQKIKSVSKLSLALTVEEINLPEHASYIIGKEMKDQSLKTNQLRKIFDMIKQVENESDINKAKTSLYSVLPMVAYSAGRGNCPKDFFELLQTCINPSKLVDENDIKALISFIEAIVAYSKYNS